MVYIFAIYSELDFKCFEDNNYISIFSLPPVIITVKGLVSLYPVQPSLLFLSLQPKLLF